MRFSETAQSLTEDVRGRNLQSLKVFIKIDKDISYSFNRDRN